MHQTKITKTDQKFQTITNRKSEPKPRIQITVAAVVATPQTCALTQFLQCTLLHCCNFELCVSNEIWLPIFTVFPELSGPTSHSGS